MSWRRKLEVIFTGDTKQLERTFHRAESKGKSFGRSFQASVFGGMGKGGAAAAAGAGVALGLRQVINAARDAQVVLGQTKVAVDNAGVSWTTNAKRIEAGADAISKASSLDDEDVLRSFQVFVRGQKDVEKALGLAGLAADVARGRYTDLDSATQLVNKAAMGQIGALRRAGIQIDKNATSTQALAALQKTFGTAAEEYSKSAAGGMDRFKVSLENAAEFMGGPLSTALGGLASELADVVDLSVLAGQKLQDLGNVKVPGAGGSVGGWLGNFFEFAAKTSPVTGPPLAVKRLADRLVGGDEETGRPMPSGPGGPGGLDPWAGRPERKPGSGPPVAANVPRNMRDNLLNAQIQGNRGKELTVLRNQADWIRKALDDSRLKPKQRDQLKQDLLSVVEGVRSIEDAMASEAASAAADAKAAADDAKRLSEQAKKARQEARDKLRDALKDQAEVWRSQAESFKDAALDKLDALQSQRETSRGIADAQKAFAHAKVLGGPEGVMLARRDLEDAQLARARFLLEGAQVSAARSGGPGGMRYTGGYNFTGPINVYGVQNVKELLAELTKMAKRTAGTNTGRIPGQRPGPG